MAYSLLDASEFDERRKLIASTLGAQAVTLEPGRYVLVLPESTRQVVAGPEGLGYLVVGAEQ